MVLSVSLPNTGCRALVIAALPASGKPASGVIRAARGPTGRGGCCRPALAPRLTARPPRTGRRERPAGGTRFETRCHGRGVDVSDRAMVSASVVQPVARELVQDAGDPSTDTPTAPPSVSWAG